MKTEQQFIDPSCSRYSIFAIQSNMTLSWLWLVILYLQHDTLDICCNGSNKKVLHEGEGVHSDRSPETCEYFKGGKSISIHRDPYLKNIRSLSSIPNSRGRRLQIVRMNLSSRSWWWYVLPSNPYILSSCHDWDGLSGNPRFLCATPDFSMAVLAWKRWVFDTISLPPCRSRLASNKDLYIFIRRSLSSRRLGQYPEHSARGH